MHKVACWPIVAFLLLWGCQSIDEEDLLGSWVADQTSLLPDSLEVDLENYYIHFDADMSYRIEQHGEPLQSGTFSTDQNVLLLLQDTINHPIQIISQSPDSLVLRMNYDSVGLTLKFLRSLGSNEH